MSVKNDSKAALSVGRSNLLLISRLVVRGLLESCMQSKCRMLHSEHQQLQDFFIVVEKVLRHGFRASRNFVSLKTPDQELWAMFEKLGKSANDVGEAVQCVDQLPNIHSCLCRIRSFLRLAVMQKKLSDYLNNLIESKNLLREYYEDWALFRHETDSVIFVGSLIGLRVLDCNLYLKEDDLSAQPYEVDLNLYVKIPSIPLEEICDNGSDAVPSTDKPESPDLKTVLDQKNYLEERNVTLMSMIDNLKQRLAVMEGMRLHRSIVGGENEEEGISVNELQSMDLCPLNRVEEMETAMALLEKSVHEKQDTIVSLRQQIDDIKKINLDLYQKLRTTEENLKTKEKSSLKLQNEIEASRAHSQNKISHLEISLAETERRLKKSEELIASLQLEINKKTEFCSRLQVEILEIKDMNNFLSDSLKAERLVREDLDAHVQKSKNAEDDFGRTVKENGALMRKIAEYERTLEELGVTLSKSKLEVDDLKEGFAPLTDAQWESDKEITCCKQCQQKFSVSRRKHHCRNCGGIYCNSCSENTMPLPSSAKPVRVCDQCYSILLQRFSAKNLPPSTADLTPPESLTN